MLFFDLDQDLITDAPPPPPKKNTHTYTPTGIAIRLGWMGGGFSCVIGELDLDLDPKIDWSLLRAEPLEEVKY